MFSTKIWPCLYRHWGGLKPVHDRLGKSMSLVNALNLHATSIQFLISIRGYDPCKPRLSRKKILIGRSGFALFEMHVVRTDTSLVLEPTELRKEGILLSYLDSELEHRSHAYWPPVTNKNWHIYLIWSINNICFIQDELRHLHLLFLLYNTDKCSKLLRRYFPQSTGNNMKRILQNIPDSCNLQVYKNTPL